MGTAAGSAPQRGTGRGTAAYVDTGEQLRTLYRSHRLASALEHERSQLWLVHRQLGRLPHPHHPLDAAEFQRVGDRIAELGPIIRRLRGPDAVERAFT